MQTDSSSIAEWITSLGPGERLPVIVVGLILGTFALVFVVTIAAGTIYKIHKNRLDDSLKRELLERGMSADEIVSVIRTKVKARGATCQSHNLTKRREDDEHTLSHCAIGRLVRFVDGY